MVLRRREGVGGDVLASLPPRRESKLSEFPGHLGHQEPHGGPDTPRALKGVRFSVHPRRVSRESPKALPAPVDSPGRVLVAVEPQAAGGTERGPHRATLLDARPTAATVLRGGGGGSHHPVRPGTRCRVGTGGAQLRPSGLADARGQGRGPHHGGDPQVFQSDRIIGPYQPEGPRVVTGAPLPPDVLVLWGQAVPGRGAPLAAPLAAREPVLRVGECLRRPGVVAWMRDGFALRGEKNPRHSNIYAPLLARWGEWLGWHLRAGAGAVPAVGRVGDGEGLDDTHQRAAPADREAAPLGEDPVPVLQLGAVAERLVAERRIGQRLVAI